MYVCYHDETYTNQSTGRIDTFGVADELVILHFPEAHTHNAFDIHSLSQSIFSNLYFCDF